jgi:hypothetical protein
MKHKETTEKVPVQSTSKRVGPRFKTTSLDLHVPVIPHDQKNREYNINALFRRARHLFFQTQKSEEDEICAYFVDCGRSGRLCGVFCDCMGLGAR